MNPFASAAPLLHRAISARPPRKGTSRPRWTSAAFLWFCALGLATPLACAEQPLPSWKVAASETLPAPAEGIVHHVQTLEAPDGTKATLHFISFDGRHTFRVIDQGPLGRASLGEIMTENHCVAGSNGGYFQPDFDPVGLLVSEGKEVHPVHHARLLSGALVVTGNHITLRRSTEPLPGKHAREALQSGPFLVEGGKPLAGLNGARSARRTAVFTDGKKRWGIVSASSLTLEELGAILADPAMTPAGLRIDRALNLDGGSSTGLWAQQPGQPEAFYLHEGGIVRDFVGIVPHAKAKEK